MKILLALLCLFLVCVPASRAEDVDPEQRALRPPANWDTLAAQYRRSGLPEPPKEAPLVLLDSEFLAFSVGEVGSKKRLLIGTEYYSPAEHEEVSPNLDPSEIDESDLRVDWYRQPFTVKSLMATALQCRMRGWNKLADSLFVKAASARCGHSYSQYYQPPGDEPDLALARMTWAHYGNQLTRPDTDRKRVLAQMEKLLDEFPPLQTDPNRRVIQYLKAALVPTASPEGSIEAQIDALFDYSGQYPIWSQNPTGSLVGQLSLRGFQAVPALLNHLDDSRLTRAYFGGFNNSPPAHLCVGNIVSATLGDLAETDLGFAGRKWFASYVVDPVKARAWWQRAKVIGEERYVAEHVLPPRPETRAPRGALLRILVDRYPNRLPHLYRVIWRERPEIPSHTMARAIVESRLPIAEKQALLREAADQPRYEHQFDALRELKEVDNDGFVARMLTIIDRLPSKPAGTYSESREVRYVSLATNSPDPRLWKGLRDVVSRSEIAMRMEYLSAIGHFHRPGDPTYRHALTLLAQFMDDASPRLYSRQHRRPGDSFTEERFNRLEVRNLAAFRAGRKLSIATAPLPEWEAGEWSRYRDQVKAALNQIGISP